MAQIAYTVMAVLTRVAAEHDLSLTQLRVFGILRDHRPRMAELADFPPISPAQLAIIAPWWRQDSS
ncbi:MULTISPECIES: hypothetical protein [unclassified Frankia]|uniref:hypothetical protein n=1 Tax=unclassified Frankia TaxID=2632575 RepID=UPI00193336B3|nr:MULTISPECIES: hypothetical protein [unclassified Frankia]MBL7622848.1 hypothetical protein [Frankia sp. AgB1.8]